MARVTFYKGVDGDFDLEPDAYSGYGICQDGLIEETFGVANKCQFDLVFSKRKPPESDPNWWYVVPATNNFDDLITPNGRLMYTVDGREKKSWFGIARALLKKMYDKGHRYMWIEVDE